MRLPESLVERRVEHDRLVDVDELNRPQRDRGTERIEEAPQPSSHVYYVNAGIDTEFLGRTRQSPPEGDPLLERGTRGSHAWSSPPRERRPAAAALAFVRPRGRGAWGDGTEMRPAKRKTPPTSSRPRNPERAKRAGAEPSSRAHRLRRRPVLARATGIGLARTRGRGVAAPSAPPLAIPTHSPWRQTMTPNIQRYIQMHMLFALPTPSPDRDPWSRPKRALFGSASRYRLSSQWVRRTLRDSDVLRSRLDGHMGLRARRIGDDVRRRLLAIGATERDARAIAQDIGSVFGVVESAPGRRPRARRLAFVSPHEHAAALALAERMLAGEPRPRRIEPEVLSVADGAADLALHGRTCPRDRTFDRRAALELAHAITTHSAAPEEDYFDAVDALNRPEPEHDGERSAPPAEDASVYYLYACIRLTDLLRNLAGDRALARRTLTAAVEALATALPSGAYHGQPRHAHTGYLRAEAGARTPRGLSRAFLKPVEGPDPMGASVCALERAVRDFDCAYGPCAEESETVHAATGQGSLDAVAAFVSRQVDAA